MINNKIFEVIIVGGSYAGLSAAMALGRSLRRTLIIDSGKPCNATTPHSHNFITQDGNTPSEISMLAKQQVEKYNTVHFCNDLAIKGISNNDVFEITMQSGSVYKSKKLIFATGRKDELPDIPGFSECWGISVIHCPYCHGYEFRDRKTGILANGDAAVHLASLVINLTGDLSLLTNGKSIFTAEQNDKMQKHNVRVIETELDRIEYENGYVKNVIFQDETIMDFDAVYAAVPFVQHTAIPVSLGCELTESGHIKVDNFQKSTIPGIFACGDNSSMMRSIANAVATGNLAGGMVNHELAIESF